jgi:hypothetical protein
MEKRRLKDRALVPYDGGRHVWRFHNVATDYWLESKTLLKLVSLVRDHREGNGLPVGSPDETLQEVEDQIARRLPASRTF